MLENIVIINIPTAKLLNNKIIEKYCKYSIDSEFY